MRREKTGCQQFTHTKKVSGRHKGSDQEKAVSRLPEEERVPPPDPKGTNC